MSDSGFLIDANKDWSDFVDLISRNTGKLNNESWDNNARANRKRQIKWAAEDLLDTGIGKTAVVIGASPSLKGQVQQLRSLRDDDKFILIAVSSGLRFLLKNNIRPHYTMLMEADTVVKKFFDGLGDTNDITLISGLCSPPSILNMWNGQIKYLAIYTALKELDRKIRKWYRPVNGCNIMFPALCSQFNTAVAMAYRVLGCRNIILVGNELSFKTNDSQSKYYVEGTDTKDSWERRPHPDIYGNVVYTTYNFMTLKMALEDYLQRLFVECVNHEERIPYFINASEGGIFGVSKRYGNLFVSDPQGNRYTVVWQLLLEKAIMQTRSIMNYGMPITEESMIKRPSIEQVYACA